MLKKIQNIKLFSPSSYLVWGILFLFSLPILSLIFLSLSTDSVGIWMHLVDTVLWGYIYHSLLLMVGVATGTVVLGVIAGWLISRCRFPLHGFFQILLLLPMAIPGYVMAFIFTDQLEYAGNVQVFLRWFFEWESGADYYFPEIRSLGGAILCLILVLYPYTYLMARNGFRNITQNSWHQSRLMGYTPWQTFLRVGLPLARPNIMVGVAIVMMETVGDFGTVSYFAVNTLSRGVYDVWIDMDSLVGASQISMALISFVIILLYAEYKNRKKTSVYQAKGALMQPIVLRGKACVCAIIFCSTLSLIAFGIPAIILLKYAITYFDVSFTDKFIEHAFNSFILSTLSAIVVIIMALLMAFTSHFNAKSKIFKKVNLFASAGYGIPGTVLGVGILVPLSFIDNVVADFMRENFNVNVGLLLTGSIFGLVYAYGVRFLTLGYGGINSVLKNLSPSIEQSARTMGHGSISIFFHIHLPIIRNGVLLSAILVFVDSMKELPITLILKPLNFDTLATKVFGYASSGLLEESALGALTIVIIGLIPVMYLFKTMKNN